MKNRNKINASPFIIRSVKYSNFFVLLGWHNWKELGRYCQRSFYWCRQFCCWVSPIGYSKGKEKHLPLSLISLYLCHWYIFNFRRSVYCLVLSFLWTTCSLKKLKLTEIICTNLALTLCICEIFNFISWIVDKQDRQVYQMRQTNS